MKPASFEADQNGQSHWNLLFAVLSAGLVLRLVLLYTTKDIGLAIVDEQHYHRLALNLLHGYGFAREPGMLTSMRPPLYPFFIALIWTVTGTESVLVVRLAQIFLGLVNVYLLYRLGVLLFNRRIALLAAAGLCFYPSLIAFDFLLLTEVLFTLLLTLVALGYVVLTKTGKPWVAWATGCALGLAALTRSVLWPFPGVLGALAFFSVPGQRWKRISIALSLFLGYALVVAPWAIRNTRLQGVLTIVDAAGGRKLYMGNYEHTPLNRAWDPVTLRGDKSISRTLRQAYPEGSGRTEGQKDKLAMKMALAYMLEHPVVTLKRAIIKCANFWGLERTVIAGWQREFYQPPLWFVMLGTLAITFSYVAVMLLACLGAFFSPPPDHRVHLFFLVLGGFMVGMHALVFGHARYHLPLIPFLLLYAVAVCVQHGWFQLRQGVQKAVAPAAACVSLLVVWGREVLLVEADRLRGLLALLLS